MKEGSPYTKVHYYRRPHKSKRADSGGKYSVGWIRSQLTSIKVSMGCCICGERAPEALHFHHVDPTHKKFTISRGTQEWAVVQEELSKCEVLCANCHAKVHAGRYKRKQGFRIVVPQSREIPLHED